MKWSRSFFSTASDILWPFPGPFPLQLLLVWKHIAGCKNNKILIKHMELRECFRMELFPFDVSWSVLFVRKSSFQFAPSVFGLCAESIQIWGPLHCLLSKLKVSQCPHEGPHLGPLKILKCPHLGPHLDPMNSLYVDALVRRSLHYAQEATGNRSRWNRWKSNETPRENTCFLIERTNGTKTTSRGAMKMQCEHVKKTSLPAMPTLASTVI